MDVRRMIGPLEERQFRLLFLARGFSMLGATLTLAAAWALVSTPLVLAVPSVRNLRRRDGPPEVDPATIQPV